jgi:hypothetical protein
VVCGGGGGGGSSCSSITSGSGSSSSSVSYYELCITLDTRYILTYWKFQQHGLQTLRYCFVGSKYGYSR